MKAKELCLKKKLTRFDVAVARSFLSTIVGKNRAEKMNFFSLIYFEFQGNSVSINNNENNFNYLELRENIYMQGVYFSKIAFLDGDGDIIICLIDDDFNSLGGVNITQGLGISRTDENNFNRKINNLKNNNFFDNSGNFTQNELRKIREESHKNDGAKPKTIQKNNKIGYEKELNSDTKVALWILAAMFLFIVFLAGAGQL